MNPRKLTFVIAVISVILFGLCRCVPGDKAQINDWLINGEEYPARVTQSEDEKELIISNGLIERRFRVSPNLATIGIKNLVTSQNYLRSVRPEAKITVDGHKFNIGGLTGQPMHSYLLNEWLDSLKSEPNSFEYTGYSINDIRPRFPWKKRLEWMPEDLPWPPKGIEFTLNFKAPDYNILEVARKASVSDFKSLKVKIHYEIYDGIPLISKWLSIDNQIWKSVTLNGYTSEIIAAVEGRSEQDEQSGWEKPGIHIETDYGSSIRGRTDYENVVTWVPDSIYTSQISWELATPCLLTVQPPLGPEQIIETGKSFESFHTWELYYDSSEKERKSLSLRKMFRTIAPWVTENPILMHVLKADSASVKLAIDQCSEVGFEMVIMTFGSGFNMESGNPAYYQKMKKYAGYAHSKGIALGGYSLLASRSISEKDDVINPMTGKPGGFAVFDNSPCLGSTWGREYFRKIYELYETSGLDIIEHDGSYPGDVCASTTHPGHKNLYDSQWTQRKTITDFYRWCRSKGIYLNVPDSYYLNGSSKSGMGYREVNWSLPRAQQEIIERQNIFEGTWNKTPGMGWMFVPLTQYHGGGAAATIEPLNKHLEHYNQRLANLFGAGVQACYRGPRLYDTDSTKAVVKKWVDFYKEHRKILDSDIIHLRRPDGRDWDGFLHVNPTAKEKGLLMLYNPLSEKITRTLEIPVYYTGLTNSANVRNSVGKTKKYKISRDYKINLEITLNPKGNDWYVIY
ncbi:MAG: hypothetical protein WCL21_10390 [Mariniphaga sp.]